MWHVFQICLSYGLQINTVKQKKCKTTIFEHIVFIFIKGRSVKKLIIIYSKPRSLCFLNQSHVFHYFLAIIQTERIKKYFHFTAQSNSYK